MSEAIASKEERLVRYNANIAAADKDPQLSPETGKPLSKVNTIRFGAGFLLFGVLWMSGPRHRLRRASADALQDHRRRRSGCSRWHRQCVHRSGIPSCQPDVRQLLRSFPLQVRSSYSVDCFRCGARWRHPVPDRHHA